MHSYATRKIWRVVLALATVAVLPALPVRALAAGESAVPRFKPPFECRQLQVQYDLNEDGTHTQADDTAMPVLNEQGIQAARQWPVSMHNLLMRTNQEVEMVAAYTLKKNGAHIDATPVNWPPGVGLPPGATPASGVPQQKFIAFQGVEIGDTLVTSFRTYQKKPIIPGNVFLDEVFFKSASCDDAVIRLSAPASMNLRVGTSGVDKGQNTTDGKTQRWEWKYQNKSSVNSGSNRPPPDRIHISTFKDADAEAEAINRLMAATQPPSEEPGRCVVLPRRPNDGPHALNMFAEHLSNSFRSSEDLLKLEVNGWNTPTCVFDDGRPRLSALRGGYDQAFQSERDWSKSLARVEYLKKKFTNEAFVAMAEIRYWITYAWDARGTGYASSVSDEGWKLLRERLEKAERVLLDTKHYSSQLPHWYEEMIIVQSALNRPEDERDKVFLEGVKRYPTYYPTYLTMLKYLLPKWGGTWRTVDNLAKWSAEHTRAVDGMSMYARLYWAVADENQDVKLFRETFASWPKMKQGFEDLMARHPKSKWNLNNFARFACVAGDKQTFLALRTKVGKDVIEEAWPEGTSLDLCETKFGYEQGEP